MMIIFEEKCRFAYRWKVSRIDYLILIGKNGCQMQEDVLFCKESGNADSTCNELVVMSPFLSVRVIADFNMADKKKQDIHAKIYLRRKKR